MGEFLDWTLPSVLSNLLQALVRSILLLVVRLLAALIAAAVGLIHLRRRSLVIVAVVRRLYVVRATSTIKYLVVPSPESVIISVLVQGGRLGRDVRRGGMRGAHARPPQIRRR